MVVLLGMLNVALVVPCCTVLVNTAAYKLIRNRGRNSNRICTCYWSWLWGFLISIKRIRARWTSFKVHRIYCRVQRHWLSSRKNVDSNGRIFSLRRFNVFQCNSACVKWRWMSFHRRLCSRQRQMNLSWIQSELKLFEFEEDLYVLPVILGTVGDDSIVNQLKTSRLAVYSDVVSVNFQLTFVWLQKFVNSYRGCQLALSVT